MTPRQGTTDPLRFLDGDSEMAQRIRAHDWAGHALGPPETWPLSLRWALRLMLTTRHPVFIFWGEPGFCFFNDAYGRSLGADKNPAILGMPAHAAWSEIWDEIGPQIDYVMRGEGATWHENQHLPIIRDGELRDVYWTYSHGPIDDETVAGNVGGVLVLVTETTGQILAQVSRAREVERWRALFELAPGFMSLLSGPDHVFTVANRAYEQLVGRRDLVGRPVREVLPELVDQGVIERLDAVYRTGERHVAERQELQIVRTDAGRPELRVLNTVYAPVIEDDGSVSGIFCEGVDVTDIYRAEQARRDSEVQARAIADNAPVLLWVSDAKGRIGFFNAPWYKLTGQTEAEALGSGWTAAVHPDQRRWIEQAFAAAHVAQSHFSIEFQVRNADGRYRWMLNAAAPRPWSSGDFVGFIGAIVEIEDRRATEMLVRRSEVRLRAVIAANQGYVWTNDADGMMVDEQDGWKRLTGQERAEYQGAGWSKAVHPDDVAPTLAAWRAAVEAKSIFTHEHRVRRKDGSYGTFAVRAVPMIEDGAVREWVGVHTDVTEQRHAEQQLRDLNYTLESRVSAELARRADAEAALRQSQKLEALGVLSAGMAHDVNNMLTVVTSALAILDRTVAPPSEKTRRYIDAAADGAHRAAKLIDRLMGFARQTPMAVERVDVNQRLHAMAGLFEHALPREIPLTLSFGDGLWNVETDPAQLENVILNLVVNARDAMPDGGTLEIATRNVSLDPETANTHNMRAADYVRILVRDTGHGMPADVVEKAFNPFFTTKEVGKGTGLGLSQAHGFARQSGGDIVIASRPDIGTDITIYLPRLAQPSGDPLD